MDFKAPWGALKSPWVPVELYGFGRQSKHSCLEDRANCHGSLAWQIVLIFDTVILHFIPVPLGHYTPRFNEVERGYSGITLSVCLSVRLSVCGQNRVRSVSSRIFIGSISYLHILSSNFRRCVACNARFKIKKIEILANFLICNFDFVFFWLGIQYDSMVWIIMRRQGVSSERRHFSCSSWTW